MPIVTNPKNTGHTKQIVKNDTQLQSTRVQTTVREVNNTRWHLPRGTVNIAVSALPIAALNMVAVMGQLRWASAALTQWGLAGQILFSTACESVALSLCYQELKAELANDASFGLKLSATAVGLAMGVLNWSHDPHAAIGIVTGSCSALSPWMWRTFTRRVSRDRLFRNGQIEGRSIRLGITRWLWHPYRSFLVKWESTWDGTTNVRTAVLKLDMRLADKASRKAADKARETMDAELRQLS